MPAAPEPPALPSVVAFGPDVCGDLAAAESREWWLANGLGAYAAGTIAGSLTRRYHGLLVAPVHPPLGRVLLLAKADATVLDGDRRHPLFANRWAGGIVDPHGERGIRSFRLEGRIPVWHHAAGDAVVEQRIWMEQRAHTTHVAFRVAPGAPARTLALRLVLLVNARDHHAGTPAGAFDPSIETEGDRLVVRFSGGPSLHLRLPGARIEPCRIWYERFELSAERERGLPEQDNHLCVGIATLPLRADAWSGLVASLDAAAPADFDAALQRAQAHDRARLPPPDPGTPPWIRQLHLAADGFLIARPLPDEPDGESVIAGYPWFGDWGRDTMIALPGLALATGRPGSARRILRTFARFVDQGLLPNVFPGHGETPAYNSVDAGLWYVEAWRAYVEATGDLDALAEAFPLLEDMLGWYARGTRHGIGRDPADGLLRAGEPGLQLTWMDAKVGDWVVTPRIGKPVEVNALWFNALCSLAGFARRLGRDAGGCEALAAQCRAGFRRYVDPAGGGLLDVLDGPSGDDASVRPNQLFAVSLHHSPLDPADQARVVSLLAGTLLTPCGLRSLDPAHPDYRPRYEGGVRERDGAYHQGTVWAWLLGPYALAERRVRGDAEAAWRRLDALGPHLLEAGLGTIGEIFDAEPPHAPRGCPSQAWSVACTLQAWERLRGRPVPCAGHGA